MFLVVGESLVDLISEPGSWEFAAAPGGSPLNVAVGLAAAGHPVRLATELGPDLFGTRIRDYLTHYRVDQQLVTTTAATNLAIARLDRAGVADYDFRLGWTWQGRPALAGTTCLHTGSLAAVTEPGATAVRDLVAAARRQGIPVSYDPNVRPALMGPAAAARIEELVASADIVKVSVDDLAWLHPDLPAPAAAARWAERGPGLVVVTRGGDGAMAWYQGETIECPAPPVPVVDTVGAGDAFTAGLLAALGSGGELAGLGSGGALADPDRAVVARAVRHATAVASAACAHRGAAPQPPI